MLAYIPYMDPMGILENVSVIFLWLDIGGFEPTSHTQPRAGRGRDFWHPLVLRTRVFRAFLQRLHLKRKPWFSGSYKGNLVCEGKSTINGHFQ